MGFIIYQNVEQSVKDNDHLFVAAHPDH